ncbi:MULTISPECIES: helix-turn-helix domain-containing protein [Kitasatospora]|uniref:Helix-turn-helix transcriptional regulator n=1 Tax=Kitasatospora cathayae TaxID=3004092 RepID=A0ABY7Q1L1_9ACTN|nr:helix-turn-helix transcriptional regulator [Kitasatospora sp. HUAS 3-15]WBP86547.1 helix-turn-helix transcriptional regulator [Kitasatospora sp. HUAS 3-15]
MPRHISEHTGERIAQYRKLRHLTQRELAARAHISYSMLTKVEQGAKPATPTVIAAVARALFVQTVDLTGQPYMTELQQDELDVLIQPIREALDLYDLGADPEIAPRSVDELHSAAEHLCAQIRETRIKDAARALPALMIEATTAAHAAPSEKAWQVLASTYRTAYDITTKLGYSDLCVVALDRMAWAAERASDPVVAGVRQYLRSLVYLRSGQYDIGKRLVGVGMGTLEQADRSRIRDVAVGQLHLGAAMLAARSGDGDTAAEHIADAGRIAEATGEAMRVHWLSFGPTNVAVHQVATLAEQYRYAEAVRAAGQVQIPAEWPASRAAAHIAEVARAQLWIGRSEASLKSLQHARELAPQQMRYHPMVRETVAGLVSARRSMPDTLTNMAHWVGI